MKAQDARGVRYVAGVQAPAPSAAQLREKEILRITRQIHTLTRKRNRLLREAKDITKLLRAMRRGLKLLIAQVPELDEWDSEAKP